MEMVKDGQMWIYDKHINPTRFSNGLDVECEGKKRGIKDKATCLSSLLLCNQLPQIYRTVR